ncbi:MAG TPA: gamma carbonic anhydrase family protein [Acetobacteraceae bacterium]|nr:gamma carbonic anhydrase family protein [Acetobacteraceae bacterium]
MPDTMPEPLAPRLTSGGMIYELDGLRPVIDQAAWVAPTAVLIGAVTLAAGANIWFGCVLRGDTNPSKIGARSNIRDGTIIHVNHAEFAAIIPACTLKYRAFVGMGATIMDGAVIEEGGMLGAGALLPPGKRIGPNELWLGSPAKLARVMTAPERAMHDLTVPHYVELSNRFRRGLKAV